MRTVKRRMVFSVFARSVLLFAVLSFVPILVSGQHCKVNSVASSKPSVGANFIVDLAKIIKIKEIAGQVVDQNGEPIPIAVIDVFKLDSLRAKEPPSAIVTRGSFVSSYLVDQDGRFCFVDLPNGNYVLRVGTNQFAFAHSLIKVRKIAKGSKKPIEVALHVGN